jgi:hypothetical protein
MDTLYGLEVLFTPHFSNLFIRCHVKSVENLHVTEHFSWSSLHKILHRL